MSEQGDKGFSTNENLQMITQEVNESVLAELEEMGVQDVAAFRERLHMISQNSHSPLLPDMDDVTISYEDELSTERPTGNHGNRVKHLASLSRAVAGVINVRRSLRLGQLSDAAVLLMDAQAAVVAAKDTVDSPTFEALQTLLTNLPASGSANTVLESPV